MNLKKKIKEKTASALFVSNHNLGPQNINLREEEEEKKKALLPIQFGLP